MTWILRQQPGAAWTGLLHRGGEQAASVSFTPLADPLNPPELLDGLLVALLPVAMRHGGAVHAAGGLSAELIRNMTDFSEGWANWDPTRYRPITISADHVVTAASPNMGVDATFAWSGSLRSTHSVVRHLDRSVPGAVRPARLMHLIGTRTSDNAASIELVEKVVSAAASGIGATSTCIVTDAFRAGVIDPQIGTLPIVAGALHLVCSAGNAVHARAWPFAAQLRYPRPGPAFPDLFSSARCSVHADGGVESPPQMLRDIAHHAPLLGAVGECEDRPRFMPPCGTCTGCRLLTLAHAASGVALPTPANATAADVHNLRWRDPIVAAEATAISRDWTGPTSPASVALQQAVRRDVTRARRTEIRRWLASATGMGPIWPR